ncbi:MAG TPA: hypothetical protein DEB39_07230, partial [Planctomycetaceae bacterium]|nr:hypothetical protein [Planctomycetaceae bacterium]
PTAAEAVAAFDATTLQPLWCFSYAINEAQEENTERGWMRQNMRYSQFDNGSNEELARLFSLSGWQVPATIIEGTRVIVAPADRPALYCLDLLTGELLWKNEKIKRDGALYIACVHDGKIFAVSPTSVVALDMLDGKPLWNDVGLRTESRIGRSSAIESHHAWQIRRSQKILSELIEPDADARAPGNMKSLVFPSGAMPAGIGVHDGSRYNLPLNDGSILLIDLDDVRIVKTWKPAPVGHEGFPDENPGNLIAVRGTVFSTTPLQTVCFDQIDALRGKVRRQLDVNAGDVNAGDAAALLDRARVARFDGNSAEAIELFRRSLALRRSARGVLFFRNLLLETLQSDFNKYRSVFGELQSLAVNPEDLGEILLVYADGARRADDLPEYVATLEKMIRLDRQHPILIQAESRRTVRLSRLIGEQIAAECAAERKEIAGNASPDSNRQPGIPDDFSAKIDAVAEEVFRQIETEEPVSFTKTMPGRTRNDSPLDRQARDPQPSFGEYANPGMDEWDDGMGHADPTIGRWLKFLDYFGSLPIAGKARNAIVENCEKNTFPLLLELTTLGSTTAPTRWFDRWFDSGFDCDSIEDDKSDGDKGDPSRNPTPGRETSRTAETVSETVFRLANMLDTEGKTRDAFHYYRRLQRTDSRRRSEVEQRLADPQFDAFRIPHPWPRGYVFGEERPVKKDNELPFLVARSGRGSGRYFGNRPQGYPIHRIGPYCPFFSPCGFYIEGSASNQQTLVCYDRFGNELWRLETPESDADGSNPYGLHDEGVVSEWSESQVYLRSLGHLLLLVRGKQIVAIDTLDTDAVGTPKLLWMRSASAPLGVRRTQTAVSIRNFASSNPFHAAFGVRRLPGEVIYTAPRAICIQEADALTALDPYTGSILWKRQADTTLQTLAGDDENLFVLLPDSGEVLALDPATGAQRARTKLPAGTLLHVFGTNLVTLNTSRSNAFAIEVCDLRDMLRKRAARELALKLSNDPGRIPASRFDMREIRSNLTNQSVVRFVHYGRFIATLNTTPGNTLRIFDLVRKTDICRPIRLAATIPGAVPDHEVPDLDIEFHDDEILVLFVERRQLNDLLDFQGRNGKMPETAINRSQIRGVPSRSVGRGTLMRFDREANPLWKEPVKIERWFQLCNQPSGLPVMIFGFLGSGMQPLGGNRPPEYLTALNVIDKKTGRTRFKWQIVPADPKLRQSGPLQDFQVSADESADTILFSAQQFAYALRFTDEPPPPEEPEENPDGDGADNKANGASDDDASGGAKDGMTIRLPFKIELKMNVEADVEAAENPAPFVPETVPTLFVPIPVPAPAFSPEVPEEPW